MGSTVSYSSESDSDSEFDSEQESKIQLQGLLERSYSLPKNLVSGQRAEISSGLIEDRESRLGYSLIIPLPQKNDSRSKRRNLITTSSPITHGENSSLRRREEAPLFAERKVPALKGDSLLGLATLESLHPETLEEITAIARRHNLLDKADCSFLETVQRDSSTLRSLSVTWPDVYSRIHQIEAIHSRCQYLHASSNISTASLTSDQKSAVISYLLSQGIREPESYIPDAFYLHLPLSSSRKGQLKYCRYKVCSVVHTDPVYDPIWSYFYSGEFIPPTDEGIKEKLGLSGEKAILDQTTPETNCCWFIWKIGITNKPKIRIDESAESDSDSDSETITLKGGKGLRFTNNESNLTSDNDFIRLDRAALLRLYLYGFCGGTRSLKRISPQDLVSLFEVPRMVPISFLEEPRWIPTQSLRYYAGLLLKDKRVENRAAFRKSWPKWLHAKLLEFAYEVGSTQTCIGYRIRLKKGRAEPAQSLFPTKTDLRVLFATRKGTLSHRPGGRRLADQEISERRLPVFDHRPGGRRLADQSESLHELIYIICHHPSIMRRIGSVELFGATISFSDLEPYRLPPNLSWYSQYSPETTEEVRAVLCSSLPVQVRSYQGPV